MKAKRTVGMIGLSFLLVGSPDLRSAGAEPITWEFAGHITGVLDPNDALSGAVRTGDSFSGLYTFESSTPDSQPDDPIFGVYNNAVTGISGHFGALAFFGANDLTSLITVRDRPAGVENDSYIINVLGIPVLGGTFGFSLGFGDANGDTFQTDLLPAVPPDLALGFATVSFRSDTDPVISTTAPLGHGLSHRHEGNSSILMPLAMSAPSVLFR